MDCSVSRPTSQTIRSEYSTAANRNTILILLLHLFVGGAIENTNSNFNDHYNNVTTLSLIILLYWSMLGSECNTTLR